MQDGGADLIDIGAESSRPGVQAIDEREELSRLMPCARSGASDRVASHLCRYDQGCRGRRAIEAGASIVNDITALRSDSVMAGLVAETGAAVVLMHMQGTPRTMQRAPHYGERDTGGLHLSA